MPGIQVFGSSSTTLGANSVKETNIENGAVTELKIGVKAVSDSRILLASIPTPSATENTKVIGAGGVAKVLMVAYTGDNVTTAVKIAHQFASQKTVAFAMKSATKLPTELPTTALGKWVNESTNEGTYTFTAAPGAKEEVFILILG